MKNTGDKKILGCHLSSSKGLIKTGQVAKSIGANTFQIFTRNPRGSKAKELDKDEMEKFKKWKKENNFGPIFAHGAYTMNLASNRKEVRDFSFETLMDDLKRLQYYPNDTIYVFHPGSHLGQGVDKGMEYIIEAMERLKPYYGHTKIALEGMSGKGTEIGASIEELVFMKKALESENIGIVLDTAHLYSAGYDIKNGLKDFVEEITHKIGLESIYGIHLNDSQSPFGSRKDRHASIGMGSIGLESLLDFVEVSAFSSLPFVLETPVDIESHKIELELIRQALNTRTL